MAIPKEHHRHPLGKGGAKLQELATMTTTTITKPSHNSNSVTIQGNKEGIKKAMHKIKLNSDEKANSVVNKSVACLTWLHKYIKNKLYQ